MWLKDVVSQLVHVILESGSTLNYVVLNLKWN